MGVNFLAITAEAQAALVAGIFLLSSAVIGGGYLVRRGNSNSSKALHRFVEGREQLIEKLLNELKDNSIAVQTAASALNLLHEDMREAITESRESHSKQIEALTRLLERGGRRASRE